MYLIDMVDIRMIAAIDLPVTLRHAAILLGRSQRHIRRLLSTGQLRAVAIAGRTFVDFDSLATYTAERGIDVARNVSAFCGEVMP
jgi:hypothetical protein